METLKAFLAKDWVKAVGALLGVVATVLITQYPPPKTVGVACMVVIGVLGSLGLVSGGTSSLRSDAAKAESAKLGNP